MFRRLVGLVASLVVVAVIGSGAMAAEKKAGKAPAAKTVTGTVSVQKDDKGELTGVSVKVDERKTVKLTVDDKAKEVAALDGKKVEVTGKMAKGMLTVESFKEVTEGGEKAPAGGEKAPAGGEGAEGGAPATE